MERLVCATVVGAKKGYSNGRTVTSVLSCTANVSAPMHTEMSAVTLEMGALAECTCGEHV